MAFLLYVPTILIRRRLRAGGGRTPWCEGETTKVRRRCASRTFLLFRDQFIGTVLCGGNLTVEQMRDRL
jgi:hypothetical protein